ncbi:hypothetical protein OQA88_1943 [Cercophora sp. LCS_1]
MDRMLPMGSLHGRASEYVIGRSSAPHSDIANLVRPLDVTSTRHTTPELSQGAQQLYGIVFTGENNIPASPASDRSLTTPRSLSATPSLSLSANINRRSLPTPPLNPLVPRVPHQSSVSHSNTCSTPFTVSPPIFRHYHTLSHASSVPALSPTLAPAPMSGTGPEHLSRRSAYLVNNGDKLQYLRRLPGGSADRIVAEHRIVNDTIAATDPPAASSQPISSPTRLHDSSSSSSSFQPHTTSVKNLLDHHLPSPPPTSLSPAALPPTSPPASPTMPPLSAESAPFVPRGTASTAPPPAPGATTGSGPTSLPAPVPANLAAATWPSALFPAGSFAAPPVPAPATRPAVGPGSSSATSGQPGSAAAPARSLADPQIAAVWDVYAQRASQAAGMQTPTGAAGASSSAGQANLPPGLLESPVGLHHPASPGPIPVTAHVASADLRPALAVLPGTTTTVPGAIASYLLDRGNGVYTRLIPADMLPPMDGIPVTEVATPGACVLAQPSRPDENGRWLYQQRVSFSASVPNVPPGLARSIPLEDLQFAANYCRNPRVLGQTRIDTIVASGPSTSTTSVAAAGAGFARPKRAKIFCDKWVHEGTCAFAQQGCKFKHEMPMDKATQHQLGLFHGLPAWWKRQQAELARSRGTESGRHPVADADSGSDAGRTDALEGEKPSSGPHRRATREGHGKQPAVTPAATPSRPPPNAPSGPSARQGRALYQPWREGSASGGSAARFTAPAAGPVGPPTAPRGRDFPSLRRVQETDEGGGEGEEGKKE